jgi:hypothetical protein
MRRRSRVLFLVVFCGGLFCGILPSRVLAQGTATTPLMAGLSVAELPDSPGATVEKTVEKSKQPSARRVAQSKLPNAPTSFQSLAMQSPEAAPQDQQAQESQPAQTQSQSQSNSMTEPPSPAQKPVGTAAAGVVPVSGIAASQPAGVAIAPAKQRRARSIVFKVGAIIGAGVAVGSIVALTEATSSRPPGAH